jgi:hypothetical protein
MRPAQGASPAAAAAAASANPPATSTAAQEEGAAASSASGSSAASSAAASNTGDWMSIPGAPTVDVPGVGKVPSKTLVAIGLLLLALIVLILAVRGVPGRQPKAKAKPKASEYQPTQLGDKPGDNEPKL